VHYSDYLRLRLPAALCYQLLGTRNFGRFSFYGQLSGVARLTSMCTVQHLRATRQSRGTTILQPILGSVLDLLQPYVPHIGPRIPTLPRTSPRSFRTSTGKVILALSISAHDP